MLYSRAYFKDAGKDWVVFIHGADGSSSIWFRQIKAYREGFDVLLVDLRGHGKTKRMCRMKEYYKEKCSFKTVSRDVLQDLNDQCSEQAHFAGVSLGTRIIR